MFDAKPEVIRESIMFDAKPEVMSDTEMQTVIVNFMTARKELGATEEEIEKVCDECGKLKISGTLYELIQAGRLGIDLDASGELVFQCRAEEQPQ